MSLIYPVGVTLYPESVTLSPVNVTLNRIKTIIFIYLYLVKHIKQYIKQKTKLFVVFY